eukprot:TRINITY_DN3069_c0_g1_i2.p1 TRINITY_DN3069_c0_g1~~TRINITY_DN3069_c0_g1_i2.p1  ORF type:complete len:215 (+),score=32.38 TRINITY_DN3069_c0_g1_i2:173-817(+)
MGRHTNKELLSKKKRILQKTTEQENNEDQISFNEENVIWEKARHHTHNKVANLPADSLEEITEHSIEESFVSRKLVVPKQSQSTSQLRKCSKTRSLRQNPSCDKIGREGSVGKKISSDLIKKGKASLLKNAINKRTDEKTNGKLILSSRLKNKSSSTATLSELDHSTAEIIAEKKRIQEYRRAKALEMMRNPTVTLDAHCTKCRRHDSERLIKY